MKNSKLEHHCATCNHTSKLIMKMGGLICGNCRIICFVPYAKDGVYSKELKKIRGK